MDVNTNNESKILDFEDKKDKKSKIIKYSGRSHFTHINNIAINDENVSDSALGVLLYVLSKPCDWVIYVSQLCARFKRSKSKMYAVIEELISLGYMRRKQERHPIRGYVTGWVTEAADYPVFLEPSGGSLDPNLQDLVKTRSCKTNATKTDKYKNRKLQKTNNNKARAIKKTNKQENVVVISLMNTLEGLAISQTLLTTWVEQYGLDYVNEKIALMRASNPNNPEGYLNHAIANDWKPALQKPTPASAAIEPQYPTHDENVTWYQSLTDEDKLRYYQTATQRYPLFEAQMSHEQLSVLDAGFTSNSFFKMFMGLIGRAP